MHTIISDIPYAALEWRGVNVGQLVADLTGDPRRRTHCAHLDPDIVGWRPLFGQTGAAQGHLRKQDVGPGDLFLFFGIFRRVEEKQGAWRFVRRSPAQHVLWGWLQVSEVHAVDSLAADALRSSRAVKSSPMRAVLAGMVRVTQSASSSTAPASVSTLPATRARAPPRAHSVSDLLVLGERRVAEAKGP